ncbi:YALIA101S10e02432g1_1 [Yarrowia lipolytica]|nr:Folate synthesis bifunctional protein [Yarrowia lipolytica]SEI36173.1 YALIA101S10e02432g1_1 [Yarrowia lipolytica]
MVSEAIPDRPLSNTASDSTRSKDVVFLKDLLLKTFIGVDAWQRNEAQPVEVSMWMKTSIAKSGALDHLPDSINYATVCEEVTKLVETNKFNSLEHIADAISTRILTSGCGAAWAMIKVSKPRALLRAQSATIQIIRELDPYTGKISTPANHTDVVSISGLNIVTIIGINAGERIHRQNITIDLILYKPQNSPVGFDKAYNFRNVVDVVVDHVEASEYKTVEALVTSVADVLCSKLGVEKATVTAKKPSALTFAKAAGVEITRSKDQLKSEYVLSNEDKPKDASLKHEVYIAFGSNVGNPFYNISEAIKELEKAGIEVKDVSHYYISEPMFVQDQQRFINGVLRVFTSLEPIALLDVTQNIESEKLKRVKEVEKGPRSIDLDIILYDDRVFKHPRLTIPHAGVIDRSFVLKPLLDVLPSDRLHPVTMKSFKEHLGLLPKSSNVQKSSDLNEVVPVGSLESGTGRFLEFDIEQRKNRPTQLMGIMNITPDSFSDGGKFTVENAVEEAKRMVAEGADIIDIGGQSTRPGADTVSVEEELKRVIPVVEKIRSCEELKNVILSIDSFYSQVAEEAIKAGADIINDVTAGCYDAQMLPTVAKLGVPIILNHSREDVKNNTYTLAANEKSTHVNITEEEEFVAVLAREMQEIVKKARDSGLRSHQIILDPGVGFAKNLKQNLWTLKNQEVIRTKGNLNNYAWLIGTSRKKFIGTITDQEVAADRLLGTAATVTAAIQQGADIVRVHDVKDIKQTIKMSDAIYKQLY